MPGIGRDCGIASLSPRCRRRSNAPASIRAAAEKGGVFTSPRSQTSGFSDAIAYNLMPHLTYVNIDIAIGEGDGAGVFRILAGTQFQSHLRVQMRKTLLWIGVVTSLFASPAGAQEGGDKSPHQVRFVTVEKNVQLEVLDWGGSGRPVVLLAGLGSTAHAFDQFATKLSANYRVYGVTRRGFGRSSAPAFGYGADQLGNDVLAAIDSLGLRRPILAGHSLAGQELSSIGSRHPDRVAGLIYLDAGFDYAFYDETHGNFSIDINEIIRQLDKLRFGSGVGSQEQRKAMHALADTSLPAFVKGLRGMLQEPAPPSGPASRPMARIPYAIVSGQQKYTKIHGPLLAIFASPSEIPPGAENDPVMRSMRAEADSAVELQVSAFARGVPQARVVRIPRANHFVFRSHESEVLREMRAFIDSLPIMPD